jgi:8-oxo-dGTP pyrophosphatase MutT (NUDIX family)
MRFDDAALARLRALVGKRPAIAIDAPQYRRACVLVPLVRDGGGWSILFLRRSANLAAHSGQIAFPGGAVEDGESYAEAAVREAQEEVGIAPERVELIGRLDDLITNVSGFLVAPFIGVVHERIDYVLQKSEVDEVFEVPVDALLTPSQPEVRYVDYRGSSYPAYFYRFGAYEIWGLTGRMLKAFLDLVWQSLGSGVDF